MSQYSLLHLCGAAGGKEQSQLVGGDVTSVDLDRLDPGAQYEVQVMALVQNREGAPVSVRVTTREFCFSIFRGHLFQSYFPRDNRMLVKKLDIVRILSILFAVVLCTEHFNMCASSYCLHTAGTTPTLPTTTLRVAEVTQNSVRLAWIPLQGATGYILRWGEESGKTCNHTCSNLFHLLPVWLFYGSNCYHLSDTSRDVSIPLPASSSSYQVTGLRLGHRYRFTVQPTFASGLGRESSVDERTGNTYTHHTSKHLLILD